MEPQVFPFVSVIVPTYGQENLLLSCIEALFDQSYPLDKFEIIVIDNNPKPKWHSLNLGKKPLSVLFEARPGSYRARNMGISAAKGEILAFTDADCIPSKNWLESGVDFLLHKKNQGILGGSVEQFCQLNASAPEWYSLVFVPFDQKNNIEKKRYSGAGNLFIRKEIITQVGSFNPNLFSAGDVEWCMRALALGHPVEYAAEVKVRHPARRTLREIIAKEKRIEGGALQLEKLQLAVFPSRFWSIGVNLITPLRFDLWKKNWRQVPGNFLRFRVFFLVVLCRYIRILEWCRLILGGKPSR